MIKNMFILLFVAMTFVLNGNAQEKYTISGNMAGLPDGELVLATWDGLQTTVVGKTTASSGKFVFIGTAAKPTWAVVQTPKGGLVASFMLENAEYTLLSGGVVTGGGACQALWSKFDAINLDLLLERQKLEEEYLKAEQAKNKKKMQEIDSRFQTFLTEAQAKEIKLLGENGDTPVAAYVVASTMQGLPLPRLRERYDLLSENAKLTGFGKAVAAQIAQLEQLEVDAIAPDFSVPSSDVGVVSLHETKARLKLVYFWASGDAVSRTRNVELLRLHQQYRPKGLEIISVSLDTDRQSWIKALGEDGLTNWRNGCDLLGNRSPVVQQYCLTAIPCMFLVDEDNRIVEKGLWGKALHDRVSELLK